LMWVQHTSCMCSGFFRHQSITEEILFLGNKSLQTKTKMVDTAAQRYQQLKNEANKMAMKIPISHGDDKEDSLNIKEIIRRFENSADTMRVANQVEK